jgi:UDP-glucuronate 4-epimerase
MKILITGCCGFIGFHLTKKLLEKNHSVLGLDNLNDYYDVNLKKKRLHILKKKNFSFKKINILNYEKLYRNTKNYKPDIIINLAAVAGVRHSLKAPRDYINNNIIGFFNILELSRNLNIKYIFYASSSSVYGKNKLKPFCENHPIMSPISTYGASKGCNELLAHAYSYLYKIKTIGLRFFTVYGPWGRPDMALFKFTKAIINNKKIDIYNKGKMKRNFTYIDDVVASIEKLINKKSTFTDNFNIFNIGNTKTYPLMKFIKEIEIQIKKKAKRAFLNMQQGDIESAPCSYSKLKRKINFEPKTSIKIGIKNFLDWYFTYYKIKKKS